MVSGTLRDAEAKPWRAAAAGDADRAATTQEQYVDETRRSGVREAIAVLRGAQTVGIPAAERHAMAAKVLAESITRQARVSGLGHVTIPAGVIA